MIEWIDKNFSNTIVYLDNVYARGCSFDNCQVSLTQGGSCDIRYCSFNNCQFSENLDTHLSTVILPKGS